MVHSKYILLFSLFVSFFTAQANACKLIPDSTWNLNLPALVQKSKLIVVVIFEEKKSKEGSNIYVGKIIKTLKGKRNEKGFSINLPLPYSNFEKESKEKMVYGMGKDCEPQGVLELDKEYIVFPDILNNSNAVIPIKTDTGESNLQKIEDILKSK